MTQFITPRLLYTTLFYVLFISLFIVSKPSFAFDPQTKELIDFGVGSQKTIFPLGVLVAVIAIVSFYIFAVIDVIFSK